MKMIVMKSGLRAVLAGATALAALTLAGCGGSAANGTGGGKLDVVASFYPLEFIARTVGGDAVNVTTLTAPGVEPHDLELTPKQVGEIAGAKLVVFEKNLQPAVDEAVEQNAKDAGFDIAPAAQLEATGADFEEHEEGTAAPAAHKDNALDPHFWLDPVRYAAVVKAVEEKLASVDSANAAGYHERAKALLDQVGKLDTEFKTGLASCKLKTFVTSHEAFAYLAKRYGLTMVGIAGFTPDAEPAPARIKEVQDIVKAQHVTTIFYEELVSPKVAETIAKDVGVQTAVLSPIEGLSDAHSKETYLTLMQENLQELRKANGCS
jgi:zinc transport system substrate-binding protein